MLFNDFCNWVNCFSGERPEHIRLGQWAMINLNKISPETYKLITASPRDPFYLDENLPKAMAWILEKVVHF